MKEIVPLGYKIIDKKFAIHEEEAPISSVSSRTAMLTIMHSARRSSTPLSTRFISTTATMPALKYTATQATKRLTAL